MFRAAGVVLSSLFLYDAEFCIPCTLFYLNVTLQQRKCKASFVLFPHDCFFVFFHYIPWGSIFNKLMNEMTPHDTMMIIE